MPSAASRMSPSAAKHAVMHGKMQLADRGSSLQPFAQHAAARPEFRLNRSLIALFTAVNALQE